MNIFIIAIKEIKNNFRDVRTLIFMLAFPIVMMLIMGTALTNAFSSQVPIADMHVLYKNTSVSAKFAKNWGAFTQVMDKSGIHFEKAADHIDGKKQVQDNLYTGYVEISDSGIHFYGSSKNSMEGNIIQGMLTGGSQTNTIWPQKWRR